MRRTGIVGIGSRLIVCAVLLPGVASAQQGRSSGIAGVVKDTSGAVLPGVTVEAASPALIEKARSVVTDGEGRYNIVDLRPGTYAVTFTLVGFSVLRRDGIELTGGFTATVNADATPTRPHATIQYGRMPRDRPSTPATAQARAMALANAA